MDIRCILLNWKFNIYDGFNIKSRRTVSRGAVRLYRNRIPVIFLD